MGILIDTSIFVEAERGRLDLAERVRGRNDALFMSVITASELFEGIYRARPEFRERRCATIEGWIAQFTVLEIDLETARHHARLHTDLKKAGRIIGLHDLWLAASCLAHGLIMITANVKEFERVEGLAVENWSRNY